MIEKAIVYDSIGLKYSMALLESICPAIIFRDPLYQSKYADAVCVKMLHDAKFNYEQMGRVDPDDPTIYANMNTTSIGNAAYLSLHSPFEEVRVKCKKMLLNCKSFYSEEEAYFFK